MVEHLRKKPDKAQIEARTNGELKRLVYDTLDPADFSKEVLALSTERLLVESCGEVGWSDLGEPRRFIEALTENGEWRRESVGGRRTVQYVRPYSRANRYIVRA